MFKGYVLRNARKKAGYTLVGLAEALKEEYGVLVVDYTTLSQWEINPIAAPRKGNLKKVADFLKLPIEELYEEESEKVKNESDVDILELVETLIKVYRKNPNDKRLEKVKVLLL